jgi:hypothetical protein
MKIIIKFIKLHIFLSFLNICHFPLFKCINIGGCPIHMSDKIDFMTRVILNFSTFENISKGSKGSC